MSLDEYLFKAMSDPTPAVLSPEQRLAELYAFLRRVACGSGRPGDRPLAGGVELFAKNVLNRHGIAAPTPDDTCPYCGRAAPCDTVEM